MKSIYIPASKGNICKLILAIVLVSHIEAEPAHSITIDDFSTGSFEIRSEFDPESYFSPPTEEVITTGGTILESSTGSRRTWVRKGMDFDPAIARINNGQMTFILDNDECQGGLEYSDSAGINFNGEDGVAFDTFYEFDSENNFANTKITLTDSHGSTYSDFFTLSSSYITTGTHSGISTYLFSDLLRTTIDLTSITSVAFCFSGSFNYFGSFSLNSISTIPANTPVPEPSTVLLFTSGVTTFFISRRKRKNKL